MVDQWTLHATAETCAQLHREHSSRLAEKKQAIKTELMMAPHRGPRDVLNMTNLSDQDELIEERLPDKRDVPGGLFNMVRDAAFYTSKPLTVFPRTGTSSAASSGRTPTRSPRSTQQPTTSTTCSPSRSRG